MNGLHQSILVRLSAFLLVLFYSAAVANSGHLYDDEKMRLANPTEVHNQRCDTWNEWVVALWTDGKSYRPGEPVAIFVRLHSDTGKLEYRKATISTYVYQDKKEIYKYTQDIEFKKIKSDIASHGSYVENSIMNSERKKPQVLSNGEYELKCIITLDGSEIMKADKIHIRIADRKR